MRLTLRTEHFRFAGIGLATHEPDGRATSRRVTRSCSSHAATYSPVPAFRR